MVLTVSFALSLVIGLFVTVAGGIASANLTPASRRQDHTTSPSARSAHRQARARVHRIPPRVRDDRDTPLEWDETAALMELIWGNRKGIYFCNWGWTPKWRNSLSGKSPGMFHALFVFSINVDCGYG
jgi:hypothetical protein